MDNVKRLASSLIFVLVGLSGPSRAQDGSHGWTSGGPEGDYSQVGVLAARGNVLFAATNRGILSGDVYKSSNGGERWDRSLPEGPITSVTINPADPSVIFATTYFGPLFKSTDEGRSWRAITEGFDGKIAIYSLAIDPVDSNVIYAGGEKYAFGYGVDHGVFMKSLDGGESWQPASAGGVKVIVRDLKIDPEDRGTLYAVTETFNAIDANSGGLVRITDGGQQWTDISIGLPRDGHNLLSRAVFIDPEDHSTLYVHLETFGVYRSRDAGATWRPINDGLPRYVSSPNLPSVALSWDHHGTLYAGLNPLGLFKSVDGGDHWTPVNFGSAIWGVSAGVGPRSLLYVFGPLGLYRSADGGDSWTDASRGLAGSAISALITDPTTPGAVYAGSCSLYLEGSTDYDPGDGRFKPPNRSRCGLFRSLDRGRTWSTTSLLTPYEGNLVRALAIDARTGWIYVAISGGLFKSEDHGVTWQVLSRFSQIPWPIKAIAIDPRRTTLYLGTENGGAYKSEDGGNNWIQINDGLTVGGPPPYGVQTVTGFAIDPLDTSVIFAATQVGVYKTIDGGKAWTRVTPERFYSRVAIDPSHPQVVYAGTWFPSRSDPASGVFRSDDGGTTWTWASDGLTTSGRIVLDLVVDPRNSGVYIATRDGLYERHGGEISWRPMYEEFSNFADSVALDANAPGTLYAGTDAGVFSLAPLPASAGNSGAPGK